MEALGKLHRIALRDIWETEASHFTPWLAQPDNIALLAEAIGIDLEVEAQEKNVGPFRADILCKDASAADDAWVLIENQLERTDHTHLGQLLTYASGLSAVTIVWIAETFTEEHRAALDWLNAITEDKFNFFGLEVELWRIGDSPVAPKFNVVCKPNDWSKSVSDAARRIEAGDLSDTRVRQQNYWTDLNQRMLQRKSTIRAQKPPAQHWTNYAIGRSYFHLSTLQNSKDQWIGVILCLTGNNAKAHFALLQADKAEIEKQAGCAFEWRELPGRKESHIGLYQYHTDPANRADWPRQHDWMIDTLELFRRVFEKRIRGLDADDLDNP